MNLNIFAHVNVTNIFINTTIKQNTNNNGELTTIDCIEAGTPITTKNIYIKYVPISWVPPRLEKKSLNTDAQIIVTVVIIKYWFPSKVFKSDKNALLVGIVDAKNSAIVFDTATITNALPIDKAISFSDISLRLQ